MRYRIQIAIAIILFSVTAGVEAGYAVGTVEKILVGRQGHEVYVQITGDIEDFPCASSHPNGYNYGFSLSGHAAGSEILSALMVAYSSGKTASVQGNATCNLNSQLEDIGYVRLM
jgi:hypothetical protein